jgi:addiction module RelE/StbE family toxin
VRLILWTERASADLAAIKTFIGRDSERYAEAVIERLVLAAERIQHFPDAGRTVPEFADPSVREIVSRPYRIVYRLVAEDEIHILTVHHGARRLPADL